MDKILKLIEELKAKIGEIEVLAGEKTGAVEKATEEKEGEDIKKPLVKKDKLDIVEESSGPEQIIEEVNLK